VGREALIGHFAGRPVEGIDPKYEYAGDIPLFAHAISSIAAKVTARHEWATIRCLSAISSRCATATGFPRSFLHTGKLASLMPHEKTIWPTLDFW
jgi:hypothetical protein